MTSDDPWNVYDNWNNNSPPRAGLEINQESILTKILPQEILQESK